jgi:hypothetical protein
MNDRQLRALATPLAAGDPGELAAHRRVRQHPRGWLTTILAVDR